MTLTLPHTPFMSAVRELLTKIEETFPASTTRTVTAYVVGGTAAHIYTSHRISNDFDAKFVPRLLTSRNWPPPA